MRKGERERSQRKEGWVPGEKAGREGELGRRGRSVDDWLPEPPPVAKY